MKIRSLVHLVRSLLYGLCGETELAFHFSSVFQYGGQLFHHLSIHHVDGSLNPNFITPTLRQSPRQVPDKIEDLSWTQIMKICDMICVHDFPCGEVLKMSINCYQENVQAKL